MLAGGHFEELSIFYCYSKGGYIVDIHRISVVLAIAASRPNTLLLEKRGDIFANRDQLANSDDETARFHVKSPDVSAQIEVSHSIGRSRAKEWAVSLELERLSTVQH